MVSACLRIWPPLPPPKKKSQISLCKASLPVGHLHHFKGYIFIMKNYKFINFWWTAVRRNSHDCLFRSTTTCFSIAGRHLNLVSFSMLSLIKLLVVDRRQQCHVLVVPILCMRTLNRRGCVPLWYSSEVMALNAREKRIKKKARTRVQFFQTHTKKSPRAKEAH